MKKWLFAAILGWFVLQGLPGNASFADENLDTRDTDDVNAEIQDLLDRVEKLEAQQKSLPSWLDRITIKGDFRFRYEMIDEEDKSTRNRLRIRYRLFLGAKVNDDVDVGFQLASGKDNPVSTNVTLGNDWEGVEVRLDKAYFDYHPLTGDGWNLNFVGGKFDVPYAKMSKSELLWDPDLRIEGLVANFSRDFDGGTFFGHAGGYYLREDKTGADTSMWGGQLGVIVPLGDEAGDLTFGSGIYDYGNIKGEPAFDYTGSDDFQGNTPDAFGNYAEDYNELEGFAEYAFKVKELPVRVFSNYVNNLAADDEEQAYLVGIKLNKTKDPGSWAFRYQWKVQERDAVVAAFTDSDFGGGGTDAKGHEFNLAYMVAKNWEVAATYFLNDIDLSMPDDRNYERFQFDLKFKF